ncbi:MAG: hypothetical protein HN344_07445 [Gammaproteobacteria bacterium]|jgi:anti-sigma-K factor RskA|nr:hypothetical protein [Gammaproteobacteria bacterium]
MSQRQNRVEPQAGELLAAEYALGTLEGEARADFQQKMGGDSALREEVQQWENHLGGMIAAVPEVQPPSQLWSGIEQRLGWAEAPVSEGFWASLRLWQGVSAVATAAVAVLALLLINATPLKPEMLYLVQDQGRTEWIVNASHSQGQLAMRAVEPPHLPEGEVCKLWIRGTDGRLHSLGTLPHEGELVLPLAKLREQLLSIDAELLVTVEKQHSTVNTVPAGRVVSQGKWIRL